MNRSQKLEVRSQKLEVRSQKLEVCLLSSVLCPLVFCFLLLILISCTGMKIEREQRDGGWIKLSEKPFVIRSLDIAKDQVLLTESNIMEGEYDRVMIRISNASVRRNEKFHTLALPQPNGEVELKGDIISIGSSESRAIFLTWEPDKSVSNNYLFSPSITIESQRVSPKTLLLYVANSGSNS